MRIHIPHLDILPSVIDSFHDVLNILLSVVDAFHDLSSVLDILLVVLNDFLLVVEVFGLSYTKYFRFRRPPVATKTRRRNRVPNPAFRRSRRLPRPPWRPPVRPQWSSSHLGHLCAYVNHYKILSLSSSFLDEDMKLSLSFLDDDDSIINNFTILVA